MVAEGYVVPMRRHKPKRGLARSWPWIRRWRPGRSSWARMRVLYPERFEDDG